MRLLILAALSMPAACASPPRAQERPRFWEPAMRDARVRFQDGGTSIAVPGGAVWLFGDTFLEDAGRSNTLLRLRVDGERVSAEYLKGEDGRAREVLRPTREKERLWPAGGIHLDGRTYVYFDVIEVTGTGSWDFKGVGHVLARAGGDMEFERVAGEFPLSAHAVVPWEEWLYLYYVRHKGDFDGGIYLARARPVDIEVPSKYEFWNGGDRFDAKFDSSPKLLDGMWGQVSVALHRGRFVLMHVGSLFDRPREVFVRTASRPWGAFGEPRRVFGLPGELGKDLKGLVYCAYLHPELFRGRKMAFTYCVIADLSDVPNPTLVEFED